MSEYRTPATRKAIKTKVKALLMDWLDETLDTSGDTSTIWDDADQSALGTYEDEIEAGKSHSEAQTVAKDRFYEVLRGSLPIQVEEAFEALGQ